MSLPKKSRLSVMSIIDKLPKKLQSIVIKITAEARLLLFRIELTHVNHRNIPHPARVYWISPQRIVYHTNYLRKEDTEAIPFACRVFTEKMRGAVVDGNWDMTNFKFTDLSVYEAFKRRIRDGAEWQDTEFYKVSLRVAESGGIFWGIEDRNDLDKRCKYFDSLIESIKNKGYRLNQYISTYDEIDVNIGRNGEYLFQNGVHRLSIAKILGIKYVPVTVFVRHKEWQEFREFVFSYAQQQTKGKLCQPIVHPDLADVPYDLDALNCPDLMKAIKHHLGKERGIMLDIGANLGFFCHKFEDLGYHCYAVEQDPPTFRILEKIKIAENKKFEAINRSIFEVEFVKNMTFDVVLALNTFHHFLKRKTELVQLKDLLKNMKMDQLFLGAHQYQDDQMKDAYANYTQTELVDFLAHHTSLSKFEVIYTAKNGGTIFRLSK
jgi:hypothetical protein